MPARTELRWEGKYDAHGKRVLPLRVKLPFQTVETVNESTRDRQTLFRARPDDHPWRNRLIWRDKKYVLPALLDEFAGKVNLIYIDPPFDTGADFSFTAAVPDAPDDDDAGPLAFTKEPSIIEQKAYRDTWGRGLDSYLQWFYETVTVLHDLLAENGSIFVHLDDNIGPYAKVILDEVFGSSCYQNEVIWQRTDTHNDARYKFGNIHDTIYWYGKVARPTYYPGPTLHRPPIFLSAA
jgi:adenine-specific DNA-methyltransferase